MFKIETKDDLDQLNEFISEYQLDIEKLESFQIELSNGEKFQLTETTWEMKFGNIDKVSYDTQKMSNEDMESRLVFGKDPLTNIVSIDVDDNNLYMYREMPNGELKTEIRPFKQWILSSRKPNRKHIPLGGSQYFKYLEEYEEMADYQKYKAIARAKKVDFFTINNPAESAMVRDGMTFFKGLHPTDVSILSFDLETTALDPKAKDAEVLLISNTFRKQGKIVRKLFAVDDYDSDCCMIESWCEWVREINPTLLCGHNVYGFDFPYLERRGGGLWLGRDGSKVKFNSYPSKFRKDGSQVYEYNKINIHGRQIIDTFFLSIKWDIGRKMVTYRLKDLVKQLGLEKEKRTFYDASTIKDNWNNPIEREKIKKYCMDDADDSLAIYDHMSNVFFYLSRIIPKSYQEICLGASGSQINSVMCRAYLMDNNSIPKQSEVESYQGATSLGIPGIYKNVVSFDVVSLYPSIMLEHQVYSKLKDPKRYSLIILEYLLKERLLNKKKYEETKDEYYNLYQNALKVLVNSFYGFLGTRGLCFNYPEGAALVTKIGRDIMSLMSKVATGNPISYWLLKSGEKRK